MLDDYGTWKTPHKVADLTIALAKINISSPARRARHHLFRKVRKAFSHKDFELARLRRENEALKAEIEHRKGAKKKKVELSPNSKFATIKHIRRAQRAVGRDVDSSSESEGVEEIEEVESCMFIS